MQRPAHVTRFALGVEAVGDRERVRIRFQHGAQPGIELGDAREIRGANGMRGARAGAHRVLQLRDGRFCEVEIGRAR